MPACLLIGGGGFIGSHLARKLASSGDRRVIVVGRSALPRFALPASVSYVRGDAADPLFLASLLGECDEVVDLAYSTVPKTSFEDPVLDVTANLPASVTLLKVASQYPLRKLLLVSSGGTVYGNPHYLPIDEQHPTNPVSPYGITKLALEKYGLMFYRQAGLPVVIVRPGNPYGPGQIGNRGQGFIGVSMFAALEGLPLVIFGERGTVRDYIYIDDLVDAMIAALESGRPGTIYNAGSGEGLDNVAVLERLRPLLAADGLKIGAQHQAARAFDVAANVLSTARLTFDTGWRLRTQLDEGLAATWAWVKRNRTAGAS